MLDLLLNVTWRPEVESFLKSKNPRLFNALHSEFARNPHHRAVSFGPEKGRYITPLANTGYSVVWQHIKPDQAQVIAAICRHIAQGPNLTARIKRLVIEDSAGQLSL